jgi:recombination protein RecT
MANNQLEKKSKVEEIALAKIQEYQNAGMTLPIGFNPSNSLKKARFILNDMKVNGKPVLEVCSQSSIVQCLLDSVAKGLDFSEMQIYFIPRGNVMSTMESVYGRILRAKRASKNYKPIVGYVHEDDDFEFNIENGITKITKHTSNLDNLDKPIVAAYAYVTDNEGNTDVTIMTKREWLSSWKKSSNGCSVAKEFEKDMIFRTIIKKSTKTLVNSNSNSYFSSVNEDDDAPLAGDANSLNNQSNTQQSQNFEEFEEAEVVEEVNKETGEVKKIEEPKEVKEEPKVEKVEDEDF